MKSLQPLLKKIAGLRILVIGDVMLDHYIWGDATRISPEAPVPVVDIARDSWTAGGAANVAMNIGSLGARCTVAGFIGEDEAGVKLREILHKRKIATLAAPGKAATIVKLLESTDALRRPQRFELMLNACECDYRGRAGLETRPYPGAEVLRKALVSKGWSP